MKLIKEGGIVVAKNTGETSKYGVFAGGNIIISEVTIILAMGAGKKAILATDRFLSK